MSALDLLAEIRARSGRPSRMPPQSSRTQIPDNGIPIRFPTSLRREEEDITATCAFCLEV